MGADPVYYANGPSVPLPYHYRRGSVMDYIHRNSSVFAICLQKSAHDEWADSLDFQSTVFVPSSLYAQKYFNHFKTIDFTTARDLALTSIIHNWVRQEELRGQELVPTYKQSYIRVATDSCGRVRVNELPIRESIECDNGIVHVLDGFLSLAENYLD
jgi:hypothetical protein